MKEGCLLHEHWVTGMWTDVVLVGQDRVRVRAHRLILAASSPILRSLLVSQADTDCSVLLLPSLPGWVLELVISTLYGQTAIDTGAIGNELLTDAAKLLGVTPDQFPTTTTSSIQSFTDLPSLCSDPDILLELERLSKELFPVPDSPSPGPSLNPVVKPGSETVTCSPPVLSESHEFNVPSPIHKLCDSEPVDQYIIHTASIRETYKCAICGNTFENGTRLKRHMESHGLDGIERLRCDICKKQFRNKVSLRTHKNMVHKMGRKYTCAYCGKVVYSSQYLMKHETTHTGEKFKGVTCKYCGKTVEYTKLKNHELTHTGEKPFKCPDCDYRCIQRSNLRIHMKGIHKKDLPRLAVGQKRYSGVFMDGTQGNMDPFDLRSVIYREGAWQHTEETHSNV